jgi:hypothetical protein
MPNSIAQIEEANWLFQFNHIEKKGEVMSLCKLSKTQSNYQK